MSEVLRPYQQSVVNQVQALWNNGVNKVIVVLPTAGGKTVVAGELAQPFQNPFSVCNTRVLCDQLEERLCRAATWHGLRMRQQNGEGWPFGVPDMLTVDEVHVGDSPDWQHVFEMVPPECKVLGLTATPWRFSHGLKQQKVQVIGASADGSGPNDTGRKVGGRKNSKYGRGLGDIFDAMIVGATPKQLVRAGYLVPLRVLNVVEAQDAAARMVGLRGPSYSEKKGAETGRLTANSDIRLDPVDAWFKYGENRKTIAYAHMVSAAERTAAGFKARGVACEVVHGKLEPKVVRERIAMFARNELKVLVNVMQLTAGFDCPDVECLIIDRGANNLNTYIQMCGRGARIASNKTDCLILDLTGCSSVHGDPQKDQDYWVVTSEGRAVSDLCCEVCGTRLSPMFPQRCMKCDPFRPKLGDPKELLDTGMRVYCIMKDALASLQLSNENPNPDDRDAAITAALEGFEPATDEERKVWEHESKAAIERINQRRLEAELEAQRIREEQERAELQRRQDALREELAAKRQAAHAEWWAAEQAKRKAAGEAHSKSAADYAANYRARQEEKKGASLEPLTENEATTAKHALTQKFRLYMQRGWSLSSATRDVRQTLPRFAGSYARENFTVPPELQPVLAQLSATWEQQTGKSLAAYELDRMLDDPRTSKFGEAWCRKKVRELFGAFEYRAGSKGANLGAPHGASSELISDGSPAPSRESLDEIPF